MRKELSPQEIKVTKLILQGNSMLAAGFKLGIGERTVRFHIENAKKKIGARTLAHLAALYIERAIQDGTYEAINGNGKG